jgi:predicted secreted Zn-dependent protease
MMTRTKRKLLAVVTLAATATSAHATVQVDTSMKYYDVTGTTPAAILASLNSLGPLIDGKRQWAQTLANVKVTYYLRADNDSCRVTSVKTTRSRCPSWSRKSPPRLASQSWMKLKHSLEWPTAK